GLGGDVGGEADGSVEFLADVEAGGGELGCGGGGFVEAEGGAADGGAGAVHDGADLLGGAAETAKFGFGLVDGVEAVEALGQGGGHDAAGRRAGGECPGAQRLAHRRGDALAGGGRRGVQRLVADGGADALGEL